VFVELFCFVEGVFVVGLTAVFGVRSIPSVGKIAFVTRFDVLLIGGRPSGDVGPLWAGLIFAADLLVTGGVGEVN
jgi:hypothetical protein